MSKRMLLALFIAVVAFQISVVCASAAQTHLTQKQIEALQRSVRLNNYENWWFLSDDDPVTRLQIVARHDLICYVEAATWSGVTPDTIRAINPGARVYQIYILCYKSDLDYDWYDPTSTERFVCPVPKAEIDANDWWLRDGNGTIVTDRPQAGFLDVGKPGFKESFLSHLLDRLSGNGFDGVVFDYWYPTLQNGFLAIPGGWFSTHPMPANYPTNTDWQVKAWQPFVAYVCKGLHDAGYRIIGNSVGEYRSGDRFIDWERSQIEGNITEQWAVSYEGQWLPTDWIENRINNYRDDPLEAWAVDLGISSSDPLLNQKRMVSLAMYYIAIPLTQAARSYHYLNRMQVYWDPLWDFNIGIPIAPFTKTPGKYFWSRTFSDGLVLLNYESTTSIAFRLSGRYQDSSGQMYSGNITLKPHTALILKRK